MKETGSLPAPAPSRKRRWDKQSSEDNQSSKKSAWDQETTPSQSRWDETPGQLKGSETPGATPSSRMWEATPSYTPAAGSTTPGMIINDILHVAISLKLERPCPLKLVCMHLTTSPTCMSRF